VERAVWYALICELDRPRLVLTCIPIGDLVFLRGLGQHILVLNSREAITDLLEQRPSTYSHRPRMIMAGDLMGLGQVRHSKNFHLTSSDIFCISPEYAASPLRP
jgi:hypothetical protein